MRAAIDHGDARRARMARRALALVGAAVLGASLAACTPSSNAIGPPESSKCLLAIAAARDAVLGEGRYAGVRYVSAKSLAADLRASRDLKAVRGPRRRVPPALAAHDEAVCVVAWRGRFVPAALLDGWPPERRVGRLAVVVVDQNDDRVIVTIVLEHPPLGLGRAFPHLLETPILR